MITINDTNVWNYYCQASWSLKKIQITIKYFKRTRQLNCESFWITI